MSTETIPEVTLDDLTSDVGDFPCQGENHPLGIRGHDGGPARWMLCCPKCPSMTMQCDGRISFLRTWGFILCVKCNRSYSYEKWRKVPL